ncbi:MAG: methyltransferase domain-containing protein [Acidimicrobiales bacterium]|uniref:Protein-L-isoaspartate O-methyltransferase n=1 Tax=Candidatus Aeolococcus gillhamiae TaxID=3127015 RepID=A0A2W5ZCQ2_9BACT|nr:MAG: hypothetical protein DLM65_07505 [Candidatus Dormibacter sp. RRmetagenome_bin12]
MDNSSSMEWREKLVQRLRAGGVLHDGRIADALLHTPRELFVPRFAAAHGLEAVYEDEAIVSKWDEGGRAISSSSQPAMMVMMIEAVGVRSGERILEIGAGTGYNAAILAHVVGTAGTVISVELDEDLALGAAEALASMGSLARVVVGDGYPGWPDDAPYDAVIATACVTVPPRSWHDQTTPSARVIAPMSFSGPGFGPQLVVAFDRDASGFVSRAVIPAGFVLMRHSTEEQPCGEWISAPGSSGAGQAPDQGGGAEASAPPPRPHAWRPAGMRIVVRYDGSVAPGASSFRRVGEATVSVIPGR